MKKKTRASNVLFYNVQDFLFYILKKRSLWLHDSNISHEKNKHKHIFRSHLSKHP